MPFVTASDLGRRVVDAGARLHRHLYEFLVILREFDDSGEWAISGSASCARWVADSLDVERCTARDWLRVSRALAEFPVIERGFADGSLSYSKVRALIAVATPENEAALIEIAQRTCATDLARTLAGWLQSNEKPEQTEKRQQRVTGLRWRLEPDGTLSASLRLPPAAAGAFIATIDRHVMRARRGRYDSTERFFGALGDGWPSLAQQRAFAAIDLLTTIVSTLTAELVIHVRGDGNTLDDGTPIPDSIVERLAPTAFLRALIVDAERRPVNASTRRRRPTTRQRRVVLARQPRCIDCGTTDLIEYDHHPAYQHTNHTHTDQLETRCAPCHHNRHQHTG